MKLLIVIPALDEEESIAEIIGRTLAVREEIIEKTGVTAVDVTVVSDGSTDLTVERAQVFGDRIELIVFEKNRGYGAAIKEAWRRSDADLLGFLDADGTCDPLSFVELCRSALGEDADLVLGCRLNPDSRMPSVRRVGNLLFSLLLSAFASRRVRDPATGMRVVRRTSLDRLMPLPDGMHFTPAMTARAILSGNVKVIECDMPYRRRQGISKLQVLNDGVRFLRVLMDAAFLYCPSRPLFLGALILGAGAAALIATPAVYYLDHRSLQEWMIYRFVVSSLALTSACLLFSSAYLANRTVALAISNRSAAPVPRDPIQIFFDSAWFWAVPTLLFVFGVALVIPSLLDLVRTGATFEHWSRFIAMSTLLSCALILIVTRVVGYTFRLIEAELAFLVDGRRSPSRDDQSSLSTQRERHPQSRPGMRNEECAEVSFPREDFWRQ